MPREGRSNDWHLYVIGILYLEGHGDLVSGLIMGMNGLTI